MEIAITFGFARVFFAHKTSGNAEKGRKLKEAGHVQNTIEKRGFITSKVIRQTSVNLPPYDVKITIDTARNVTSAVCGCIAGISGHCKHISAVIFYINDEDSSTRTSVACGWKEPSVPKFAKAKYCKGQRWTDIFGVRQPSKVHMPFQLSKDMVTFQMPSMLQYMLQDPDMSTTNEKPQLPTVRIISNVLLTLPLNNDDLIKKVCLNQSSSLLLQDLYNADIEKILPCCVRIYNQNIPCNSVNVCLQTLAAKDQWLTQRRFRITASRAYSIYTYKGDNWPEKSQKYFFPKTFSNKFTEHGIAWEPIARSQYSRDKNCQIVETGLVICQTDPWLAVSPDGVVFEHNKPVKLLEIKCPFKGKSVSAEAIEDHCIYLKRERGRLVLKKKHIYFAQVQLNMAVLNLELCDFVVFCSVDKTYKIINVPFDVDFTRQMLLKLKHIYFQKMLHTLCQSQT